MTSSSNALKKDYSPIAPPIRPDYLPFGRPNFSKEEMSAVGRVLESGWISMGPETESFEEELALYLGAPNVVTVDSCTSALFLSLLAHGVTAGDEVICPSLTWCSTANAALYLGARPVFCDIDPHTLCATPELIEARLSPKTKAVIVVHLGGLAVEVEPIRRRLPQGVHIIEDAAHALGARFENGRPVGASGNATCFSFYANKNLSTAEGGAIALNDPEMARHIRSLRLNAMESNAWSRYTSPLSTSTLELTELGYKMNYTDLQASIGRVQLRRQEEFHAIRQSIASAYHSRLSEIPNLAFQRNVLHPSHARHLFQIVLPRGRGPRSARSRDELLLELRKRNVGASIHYAPLHQMPLYAQTECRLPITEDLSERILTLPMSSSMTLDDAEYVLDHLLGLLQWKN